MILVASQDIHSHQQISSNYEANTASRMAWVQFTNETLREFVFNARDSLWCEKVFYFVKLGGRSVAAASIRLQLKSICVNVGHCGEIRELCKPVLTVILPSLP